MFNGAWLAGGIPRTACVAAFEPICAVSLADSYINRANPGTYDATAGTAPTWAAETGWTFNGSTQYLNSNVPSNYKPVTIIARLSVTGVADYRAIIGTKPQGGANFAIEITSKKQLFNKSQLAAIGASTTALPLSTEQVTTITYDSAGVYAFYLNGAADGNGTNSQTFVSGTSYIGRNENGAGTGVEYFYGTMQAVYIYNVMLMPTQVKAVTDAVNMLPMRPKVFRMKAWMTEEAGPTADPPATPTRPLSSDRLYNRSLARIFRRGETG